MVDPLPPPLKSFEADPLKPRPHSNVKKFPRSGFRVPSVGTRYRAGMEVNRLPTPVKSVKNMSKHLTSAEREAREDLETRTGAASGAGDDGDGKKRKITKPRMLKGDKAAAAHWTRILKIMKGLEILDALDADILGIYCAKLARRDELQEEYLGRRADYAASHDLKDLKAMVDIEDAMRPIERELLNYASKLGLTPESRARLARRMAEQEDDDPDADLFA